MPARCCQRTAIILASLLSAFKLCETANLHRQKAVLEHQQSPCLEFVSYEPSHWEQLWLKEAQNRQHNICGLLKQEHELGRKWIKGLPSAEEDHERASDQGVWSSYQYRNVCSTSTETVRIPIEPAVGLLRNPFAQPCSLDDNPVYVEDRNHMLLAPRSFASSYPGKALLFDLGSGKSFDSSLRWLVDKYQARGVEFKEIWAWEVQETDQQEYWQNVPDELVGNLHFYNTFASDNAGLPSPLAILKSRFVPGDFVVVKLDIDNETLESSIMEQVSTMNGMIAEMFFEKHFDAPEMHAYFGAGLASSLGDTLAFFNTFRKAGLRLHYWP